MFSAMGLDRFWRVSVATDFDLVIATIARAVYRGGEGLPADASLDFAQLSRDRTPALHAGIYSARASAVFSRER